MTVKTAGSDADIARCMDVMRELRPHLTDAADFVSRVRRQEKEGYALAYIEADGRPVACMGYRGVEMLHRGKSYYVDDLVTASSARSGGHGAELLDWLEAKARAEGRLLIVLDSGTQRIDAHRFYHRQGYTISAFNFKKTLAP